MSKQTFNLVTDPWIKVIDNDTDQDKEVSLIELFENAQHYRRIAGEMRSQDLAILRFLLAILTTVYSRFDADDDSYEWLEIDPDTLKLTEPVDEDEYEQSDLYDTWQQLFQQGHFSTIITRYLNRYKSRFDLFGERPFYQVTAVAYDAMVPTRKSGERSGMVMIKQINRLISESENSPNIFTPKVDRKKNQVSLDELVRWLITYQNFTDVAKKTVIKADKYGEKVKKSAGWLYKLNPVFASGETLFETLMLNLILVPKDEYIVQKPVWEYDTLQDYVSFRQKEILPDDLANLYTAWSRLLYIEWDDQNQPTIFAAGIPMYSNENAFIEPMTTWRFDSRKDKKGFKPAVKSIRSLGIAMWRNFGQYVNVHKSGSHEPGIVSWLHTLERKGILASNMQLELSTAVLINDGNSTSQLPIAEVADEFVVKAEVLFDTTETLRWPERIENVIDLTQQIGKDYQQFIKTVCQIRSLDSGQFVSQYSAKFYDQLNQPFKQWLAGLSNDDNRDDKELEWQKTLKGIVLNSERELMNSSTSRDFAGISETKNGRPSIQNIFTASNQLRDKLKQHLSL